MTLIGGPCMRQNTLPIDTDIVPELAGGVDGWAFSCTLEIESANLSDDIYREKKRMSAVGTEGNPLRVAIIGSGPAGFYTVSNFLKKKELAVEFDMYDRLPTPFGLVRAGVAPDHQKDKSVQRA